ncbi:MAG: OmpA family protein [Acidimicrobiia bacterium]|nr:OmpA family protein [Acidimicrobiia bacterium]NNF08765.1 OmpA family protein [Acidimicrobiia bacterium]
MRKRRYLTILTAALLVVAGSCGGSDDEPSSETGLSDCSGFFLGTFGGDRSGPFVLGLGDDGSLSAAFVGPDTLGIDLSNLASLSGLVEQIGLEFGEDIILSTSGIEIAPGALSVGTGGVRLGNIEIGLAPVGSVEAGGTIDPGGADTAGLTGDFRWGTCTGSGEWVDGEESGRWQVAVAAGGTLSAENCEGAIYVGLAPDLGGLDLDLDAFCLSSSVVDLPIEPVEDGIGVGETDELSVYTLDEVVLFAFGSADLTEAASNTLDTVVAAITQQGVPRPTIQVIGHTDSIGSAESNLRLSERRAEAVRSGLAERLPEATLTAFGLGETNPKAANANPDGTDNPDGRRQNRRVEIFVTG